MNPENIKKLAYNIEDRLLSDDKFESLNPAIWEAKDGRLRIYLAGYGKKEKAYLQFKNDGVAKLYLTDKKAFSDKQIDLFKRAEEVAFKAYEDLLEFIK
jgi:hypothetical protein